MADYINKCRTNYFHVKDPAAFREFMESAIDIEELWEEKDKDGNPVFGFSAYGFPTIPCKRTVEAPLEDNDFDEEYDDLDTDAFVSGIQSHLADDDALIFTEIGSEKMRYLVGCATVITKDASDSINLDDRAITLARKMLRNPKWQTKNEY